MPAGKMYRDELDTDVSLVRQRLAAQFPPKRQRGDRKRHHNGGKPPQTRFRAASSWSGLTRNADWERA
jgi:hypothetical protein